MTRTFIALEMNEAMQLHLGKTIHHLAQALPSVRWVEPASIHLTLAFLGELNDKQLVEVAQAASTATQQAEAFSYRLTRLGIFGSRHRPQVIWMGIEEPSGRLLHLHRLLNQQLTQRGFELDTRPFSPHLTLARVKTPLTAQELQWLQSQLSNQSQGMASTTMYLVQQLNVMKSELSRTGAQYTCLQEYVLG